MKPKKKKTIKWNALAHNQVLSGNGFYISFNSLPGEFILSFRSDDDSCETALVKRVGGHKRFYILNGDFRKEYEKLVSKGFKACMEFFRSKEKEHKSSWSN